MKQNHYLIVGASSVAGKKSIEAIRLVDENAKITVTTSKELLPVSLAVSKTDAQELHTIYGIDLTKPDTIGKIQPQLTTPVDVMVFCPAFGMVGYPAELAPMNDLEACFDFSVRPLLKLVKALQPQLTIGFSSFYWLRSLEVAYGSMAFAKYALEKLAVENPDKVHIVRAGLFPSKSLRAICLLIQRGLQKESFPGAQEIKSGWKQSGLSFGEYFTQFAQGYEKSDLAPYLTSPYRGTEENDLVTAIATALAPNAKPIINVVGSSIWQETALDHTPDFMRRNEAAFALSESVSLSDPQFQYMKVEINDHIGYITLDHQTQNAFNAEMLIELGLAHDQLENDPDVWGVIFTSASDTFFSSGLDPQFMLEQDRAGKLDMFRLLFETTRRIYAFSKPEIVLLPGHAFAAGSVLAMAADWRIMATGKSRISFPEVMLGISMPEAMIRMIASQVGTHNIATLIQTGDMFKAEDCLRLGVVHELVERDELLVQGEKFMRKLFQKPLAGIRAVKRNLRRENLLFFENDPSLDLFEGLMGENFDEALRSGVEGRRPRFVNP